MSSTEITFHADLSTDDTRHYDVIINGVVSISTTVTSRPDAVDAWLNATEAPNPRRLVIGLGVEILPWGPRVGEVATLHLSVSRRCLVFQIHMAAAALPPSLEAFFTDPKNIFVGVNVWENLEMLRADYGIDRGESAVYEDLGALVAVYYRRRDLGGKDASELAVILNGVEVEKPVVDPEWHVDVLSEDKVMYASVDGYLSWEFGYVLLKPEPDMSAEEWNQLLSEQASEFFDVPVFGAPIMTRVTKRMIEVEHWIDQNMNDGHYPRRYVGFDLEFFYLNDQPHIGTVQFCVGNECLVIQFHQMNRQYNTPNRYLANLETFLLSDDNIFVGVDVARKMHMLLDMLLFVAGGTLHGIELGRVAADIYQRPDLVDAPKDTVTSVLLWDREVEKPAAGDDWDRWTLTHWQVEYACVDAVVPFEISRHFQMN